MRARMRIRIWLPKYLIAFMVMIVVLGVSGCTVDKRDVTEGRYLKADNGTHFLIDGEFPIQIDNREIGEAMFDGLETGDLINVEHGPVRETYPGQTTAYSCVRLERGSWRDISDTVIGSLTEHGFLISGTDKGEKSSECFFSVQYIRTNGDMEEIEYPMVRIIRSTDELNGYYEEYKDQYYLERREQVYADTTIGFLNACDRYDEDYFKDQILILVLLEEGSGSIRHEVDSLRLTERKGERTLHISIQSIVPEVGTDDMAQWHLMIEPEEGLDVEDESRITVSWDRR